MSESGSANLISSVADTPLADTRRDDRNEYQIQRLAFALSLLLNP